MLYAATFDAYQFTICVDNDDGIRRDRSIVHRLPQKPYPPRRAHEPDRREGYHRPILRVVSKCALGIITLGIRNFHYFDPYIPVIHLQFFSTVIVEINIRSLPNTSYNTVSFLSFLYHQLPQMPRSSTYFQSFTSMQNI